MMIHIRDIDIYTTYELIDNFFPFILMQIIKCRYIFVTCKNIFYLDENNLLRLQLMREEISKEKFEVHGLSA